MVQTSATSVKIYVRTWEENRVKHQSIAHTFSHYYHRETLRKSNFSYLYSMIVNQDSYNNFDYYVNMIFKSDKEQKCDYRLYNLCLSLYDYFIFNDEIESNWHMSVWYLTLFNTFEFDHVWFVYLSRDVFEQIPVWLKKVSNT